MYLVLFCHGNSKANAFARENVELRRRRKMSFDEGSRESDKAVCVWRICPIHLGHQKVLDAMIKKFGIKNCLLVIGSSNAPLTMRNFFSYVERKGFVETIYPDLQVVPISDYPTDSEWLQALDDILRFGGLSPKEVTFFGGCAEDIEFFLEVGRKHEIMNRFDGSTPKISATEVRDALIQGRPLDGLLDPRIVDGVRGAFKGKCERFKKM